MIRLEHVNKTFRGRRGPVRALDGVDLQIAPGDFVAVRGPSGSGKSTLLLTIAGMIQPTGGTVTVRDQDLYALGGHGRSRFRAESIGFVFQMFHLVPYLSVLENVLLPARLVHPSRRTSGFQPRAPGTTSRLEAARTGSGQASAQAHALELLERFGLLDRLDHHPAELSTGERQRTAIARALINDPWLLLADEPTGNLDTDTGATVMACLAEVNRAGKTVVLVTHDPAVDQHAGRVLLLRGGRLEAG